MRRGLARRQGGATLVIGLILLVFITLMVTTAFSLSTTNLKSVGNMQARDEAVASANAAIEQVIGSAAFACSASAPVAETIEVDIDNDDVMDYVVQIAQPVCMRAIQPSGGGSSGTSSLSLPEFAAAGQWFTEFDIQATATNSASGVSTTVHSGIRLSLTDTQKGICCP